jgi:hypothetical protein
LFEQIALLRAAAGSLTIQVGTVDLTIQVVIDSIAAILEGTGIFAVVADTGRAVDRVP